ncbi:MAG: penicillin-binding protein activator LpoB [Gemmatimonadetes bacterium]|nr:penicillin-binding protein activator LpoB [Gemmatimonadota bacterium]
MRRATFYALVAALIAGCGPSRQVSRIDVEAVTDLSGKWNDTDSRLVSEEMIADCLSRAWLPEFMSTEHHKPVLTVGTIRNRSNEHIDVTTFTKDMERELINSGRVKFVAGREQRDEVRSERMEQQIFSSDETAKSLAQETGADYLLKGSIATIVDRYEGDKVVYYQTDLELIHVESNEKAWIGMKKIKKFITQKGKKW